MFAHFSTSAQLIYFPKVKDERFFTWWRLQWQRMWPFDRGRQRPQQQWVRGLPTAGTPLGLSHSLGIKKMSRCISWYNMNQGLSLHVCKATRLDNSKWVLGKLFILLPNISVLLFTFILMFSLFHFFFFYIPFYIRLWPNQQPVQVSVGPTGVEF